MLYKNSTQSNTERYQGAFISDREIHGIVSYIREHNQCHFDVKLTERLEKAMKPKTESTSSQEVSPDGESAENMDLFKRSLELAITSGTISISQLQRRFQIGYARAGWVVDKMETMGYVSGNEGSRARQVFITREEFEEKYGPMAD
jgi:S-DNA-T family DNA segregation ATPase FtsK/SpoIIIE